MNKMLLYFACLAFYVNSFAGENVNLAVRYGVDVSKVQYTPNLKIPVIFRMSDHKSLALKFDPKASLARELKTYDVAIVGGGPAALTAALYLVEAGHSVIVLERNEKLGGLAMGHELNGVRAGGGAAYSAGPSNELELSIFEKIGLKDYQKSLAISEPIDSYLWNGVLYKGVWEDHTLEHLPPSFALFKFALLDLAARGFGHDDSPEGMKADTISMSRMVKHEMPKMVRESADPAAQKIWARFVSDSRLSAMPEDRRMNDVIDLLDLYGRSALGGPARDISARQFIDFYESEIHTRYTGTLGTGTVAEAILNKLSAYPSLLDARVNAPVVSVENVRGLTRAVFVENGHAKEVFARKTIFAAPITLASRLVKDLAKTDPEKTAAISGIRMTDYAVHVARLKGHPFRATYDTWSFGDRDTRKPTDFILGRWQDRTINGYEGMRDFQKDPADDFGVISIYQPLGRSDSRRFTNAKSLRLAEDAARDMLAKLGPLAERDGQKIEIELIESYRWPDSIHIVSPGFLKKIPVLLRPTGNIHYANNTVGAPELESAMARAYTEAQSIIETFKTPDLQKTTSEKK